MALWNSGKSFFPVSSCPTVGISGLATGGGYGFLARPYGLTTDYILGMRIVTANGDRLVVNNVTNRDLFWALRGGGASSFGIVTLLAMQVVPAPPLVFTATVVWSLEQFIEVFKAWQRFTLNGPRTLTAKMNINSGTIGIYFVDSTGLALNFDKVEKSFPPANSTSHSLFNYPDFLVDIAGTLKIENGESLDSENMLHLNRTSDGSKYQVERSFYVQKLACERDISVLLDFLNEVPSSVTVSFQAYGGAINDVKNDDTAFVHRNGRLALAIITNDVLTNSDLSANAFLDEYFELGKRIFNQKESYQNYADGQLSDYLQRYYGKNLGRLIQVKQKYDPYNYFHNPQSVPTS